MHVEGDLQAVTAPPVYPLAERFFAPQGEGLFTGTQMAFMRLVGCSVGKTICTACDTDFDRQYPALGGGMYAAAELLTWMGDCRRACLTGGEPLDRNLAPLLVALADAGRVAHVETSGTKRPAWLAGGPVEFLVYVRRGGATVAAWEPVRLWLTVSPKPGWRADMIAACDEVKVILGGLGDGPGWPTLEDALRWADAGKLVYVQQRNGVLEIDRDALDEALAVVAAHPQLRLSCQLHKFLRTR